MLYILKLIVSKCTISFYINATDGTSTPIKIEVPDVSEITIEDAIKYAIEHDPGKIDELTDLVNKSGTPSARISIDELKNHIPEGNHNLTTLVNLYPSDVTKSVYELLQEMGVDLNQNNILVTTAQLKSGRRERAIVYDKGSKSIALLTPQPESIEAYMKMQLALAVFERSPKDVKEVIRGQLLSLLSELKDSNVYRIKGIVNAIEESTNPVNKFIMYLYGSSAFNRALRKIGKESEVKTVFSELSDILTEKKPSYKDELVLEFYESLDNWRMSTEKLKELSDKLGTSSPLETIQEINNRITEGRYFDIKFLGSLTVIFNPTYKKPIFEFPVINSEYYGELVTPVMSLSGYNIVEHNKKYYVSNKIIQTTEDLPDTSFLTLNDAMGAAKSYISRQSLSLNNARNMVKVRDTKTVRTQSKLKSGDRFIVTDVQFEKLPELNDYDKILGRMSFEGFFREMKRAPWLQVLTNLTGYNINAILNTPEKVETFIWLRAKHRERPDLLEEYNNAYKDTTMRDTSEKIAIETKLTQLALDEILNAKDVMYEVVNRAEKSDIIEVERMQQSDEVPVYVKATKSFKQELLEIVDFLGRNFGVNYNIVTTGDINRDFKDIIPNAHRVNAFIYEGQIYINVDNATTADALHEFAHIIMGTIKRKNPKLYYGLVEKVELAADYPLRLGKYALDKRARTDLNEEIFVEKFSEYISENIVDPWLKTHSNEMAGIEDAYQDGIKKVLQTTDEVKLTSVAELNNLKIEQVMGLFGSVLLELDEDMFDTNLALASRQVTNIISQLKAEGKLTERCD